MVYTSGIYKTGDETLKEAQAYKVLYCTRVTTATATTATATATATAAAAAAAAATATVTTTVTATNATRHPSRLASHPPPVAPTTPRPPSST